MGVLYNPIMYLVIPTLFETISSQQVYPFTFHNNSHNKISINCTPTSKKYNTFTQKNSLLNNKTKLVDDLYFSATEDDEEILCTKCR